MLLTARSTKHKFVEFKKFFQKRNDIRKFSQKSATNFPESAEVVIIGKYVD